MATVEQITQSGQIQVHGHGHPLPPIQPNVPAPGDPSFLYRQYPLTNEWAYGDGGTPVSQPVNRGYDIVANRIGGQRRAAALNAANAILTSGPASNPFQMSIFVSQVTIDTAMAGQTAQSRLTRDFYPHNFVQPSFQVTGWSLDQQDFGLLCEFVHYAQHAALAGGYDSLTQLWVMGRDMQRGIDGTRHHGPRVLLDKAPSVMPGRLADPDGAAQGTYFNQVIRGSHQPIVSKGYVSTMPREHEQYKNAVQWQFAFTVTVMLQGLYTEKVVSLSQPTTWMNILKDAQDQGVVTTSAALTKENEAALKFAKHNAATVFGDLTG